MEKIVILIHVLGATVWTGGHLVLALSVLPRAMKAGNPAIIHDFESGYEKLGIPALVLQVLTGLHLAMTQLPEVSRWFSFDGPLAIHIFVKMLLLALIIALAVHARLRVMPDMDAAKLRAFAWHIIPVTILSVLLVFVGVQLRAGALA